MYFLFIQKTTHIHTKTHAQKDTHKKTRTHKHTDIEAGPDEDKLITEIFDTRQYNSMSRPVKTENETLKVVFEVLLQQIIDVVSGEKGVCVCVCVCMWL